MIFNCLTAGQKLTEVHHRHEQLAVSPNLSDPKIRNKDSIKTHLVGNSHQA